MEAVKYVYYALVLLFIYQYFAASRIRLNWILITFAVCAHAFYFFGFIGILFLATIAVISTTAELLSLKTKWNVFGVTYRYTRGHELFPSTIMIGNVLPIEVAGAWILYKYLAFVMGTIIASSFGIPWIGEACISAFILVSFDLFLDPFAVSSGAWKWKKPGIFFNIPWRNFLGWFSVGAIIALLFAHMESKQLTDTAMTMPVIIVSALMPIVLARKLFSINKVLAAISVTPLTVFILLTTYTLI